MSSLTLEGKKSLSRGTFISKHLTSVKRQANDEIYTKPYLIEVARKLMGGIDLDPASSPLANKVVQATNYYTAADNGLEQDWYGRLWCNPPFSIKKEFVPKILRHTEPWCAIMVLNLGASAVRNLVINSPHCWVIPNGGKQFYYPDGTEIGPMLHPIVFCTNVSPPHNVPQDWLNFSLSHQTCYSLLDYAV